MSEHPKKIISTFKSHCVLLASLTKSRKSDTQFRARLPQKSFAFAEVPTTFQCFHSHAWNQLLQNIQSKSSEEGNSPIKDSVHWKLHQLQHKIYDSTSLNFSFFRHRHWKRQLGNKALDPEGSLIQRITNVKKSSCSRKAAAPGLLDATSATTPTFPATCRH